MSDHPSSTEDHRVISIRTRRPWHPTGTSRNAQSSDDLDQYKRSEEPDDFRHRTLVNAAAFLFVTCLIIAGVWLADTITTMRKAQDCVLSGKRGCTPVESPVLKR
ncbi:hypothetical protein [Pseudorhodoplanes sp.]|uniref:hypothetical protein n=1 Tax=Pseudorhodoplanes sp. TaxID=1934341 RepID=UPI002B5A67A3|nr:hypothetical protein [Pseudorhodoplanes sp.]HWV53214.1 hypothetical protein [Pseudorhodoplanes sp.]